MHGQTLPLRPLRLSRPPRLRRPVPVRRLSCVVITLPDFGGYESTEGASAFWFWAPRRCPELSEEFLASLVHTVKGGSSKVHQVGFQLVPRVGGRFQFQIIFLLQSVRWIALDMLAESNEPSYYVSGQRFIVPQLSLRRSIVMIVLIHITLFLKLLEFCQCHR